MVKFSSIGVLGISLLAAGSSWPVPLARQAAMAVTPGDRESVRLEMQANSSPTLSAALLPRSPLSPATDAWLMAVLGGGVIALQLRRTQRSVRRSRVAI